MIHTPVLLSETLSAVENLSFKNGFFLDGTFGRGGHAKAILDKFPDSRIIALDQDLDAIEYGQKNFSQYLNEERIEFHHLNFTKWQEALKNRPLVGVLLDLGVSSPQLDQGPRGFSFYHDGPLDMRMDQSQAISAKQIINEWSEAELNQLFSDLGEVRNPRKTVSRIIEERKKSAIENTRKLADLIENSEGWRKRGHHPATNYFLALRLEVNQELNVLPETLPALVNALIETGRILVITFHSLEDRIVKNVFRDLENREIAYRVNKKVIAATREEERANPRSRSAQLRVMQRGIRQQGGRE